MNEMEKPIFTCSQSAFMFNLPQVMFVENAFLLLASSWLFTMVSWDTVGIPAAVFCSFLIGKTTLGDIITSKQTLEINASMFVNAQFILELHGSRFEWVYYLWHLSTGVISLVLYYRFLHPKSFEIFQSIRHRGISGACMDRGSTLSLEEKVTPTFHRHATLSGLLSVCLSLHPSLYLLNQSFI